MQTRSRCQQSDSTVSGRRDRDPRLVQACVEALEDRRMLAATATLFSNGMLQITGTGKDDALILTRKGTRILVDLGEKTRKFTASGVRGIKIEAKGGNDKIKIGGGVRSAILRGGAGNDKLIGGDGDDELDGGSGRDVMRGRSGFDTVSYRTRKADVVVSADDVANDGQVKERDNVRFDIEGIIGGRGHDRLSGGAAANAIYGGPGNDSLRGEGNADTLRGEDGDDTLAGGALGDDFFGGQGIDTVSYQGIEDALIISTDGSANDGAAGEQDDIKNDIEVVIGGSGRDRFTGGSGNDRFFGGPGRDTLNGGAGDDSLSGGDGDDYLDGQEGADTMQGDAGFDHVLYASRTSSVKVTVDDIANDGAAQQKPNSSEFESTEFDLVHASVEVIIGGSGNDTLIGGDADNELIGGAGNDSLDGGGGDDLLQGGAGTDRLRGSAGNDRFFGGADDDALTFSGQTAGVKITIDGIANDGPEGEQDNVGSDIERFDGSDGDDSIVGSDAAEIIFTYKGNDTIRGGGGDDTLAGFDGDDVIEGGAGWDEMSGQAGNDTIYGIDGEADRALGGDMGIDTVYADKDLDPTGGNNENILYEL